jgi:biotin operon repressor
MNQTEQLVALFRDRAGKWLSEAELLVLMLSKEKLEKEIAALKQNGWDITSRTVRQPTEVEGGVTLEIITQYLYTAPVATKGWSCTRCANVYTPISGEAFGDSTIDPKHRQAVCWRFKKKTFWRRIDE